MNHCKTTTANGGRLSRVPTSTVVVCLLALVSTASLATDFPQGLLIHFPFYQPASGGVVTDRTVRRHNGLATGTKWTNAGKTGGACEFTATNDCILITNSPSLNTTQMTVAVWFKTSKTGPAGSIVIEKGMGAGYALTIVGQSNGAANSGKLCFSVNGHAALSDTNVTDGAWHHCAATYDGGTARLYVDGVLQRQTTLWRADISANTNDLTIGINRSNPASEDKSSSFAGVIDEVMIFNRAVSGNEVKAVVASATPKLTRGQVARRLAELKELHERGLILKDFYDRKVKECEDAAED